MCRNETFYFSYPCGISPNPERIILYIYGYEKTCHYNHFISENDYQSNSKSIDNSGLR